ncbi:MAG: DUF3341 domain-containing protein [Planctomycetaceae bacterium]|nr:MAG: DUF3341 domain-containing protein [Planctomycetaceae bacterium]
MTDKTNQKLHGVYAEFDAVDTLLAACERVRDAGYTKTDAFTPFPVHGIDRALGIKPTGLPWIVLACGLIGTTIGVVMQVWMNTFDYPYIISGKPFFSMPAFIPVSFELTILLASFGAFFGMLALNRLPKFSNPIFTDPRFDRATDDKFFLFIDSADPRFKRDGVVKLLENAGGSHLQDVFEDDSSTVAPKAIWVVLGSVIFLSLIPLLLVARMRVTNSSQPRFHVFFDMDFSPAKGAQMTTSLFGDGRAMRPDVPGTIARGQFDEDLDFYTGIDMEELARRDSGRARQLVRALLNPDDPETPADPAEPTAGEPAEGDSQEDAPSSDDPVPAEPTTEEPAKEDPPGDAPKPEDPTPAEPTGDTPEPTDPSPESPQPETPAEDQPPTEKPVEEMKDEPAATEPAPAPESEPAAASEPAPATEPAPANEPTTPSEPAPADEPAAEPTAADANVPPTMPEDTTPWLERNPLALSVELMERGKTQFEIYCATCHGNDGRGNGLVNRRAQRILATAWVQPSSMHQDTLLADAYPDGKLFSTISNGIRKMPGYASQISVKDRWAIVAYVRALQASQNAELEDLPVDKRDELKRLQTQVHAKLAAAAEAERQRAEEAEQKRAAEAAEAAAAAPTTDPSE